MQELRNGKQQQQQMSRVPPSRNYQEVNNQLREKEEMRLKYEAELRRLRYLLNEKDSASRKLQDREMMANRVA